MVALTEVDLITARKVLTLFLCRAMTDITYFEKEKLAIVAHIDYVQKMIANELTVIQSEGDE